MFLILFLYGSNELIETMKPWKSQRFYLGETDLDVSTTKIERKWVKFNDEKLNSNDFSSIVPKFFYSFLK